MAASVAARGPVASGHPFSLPLCENSQGPAVYGAAAAALASVPSVAERTAASSARVRVTRARSAKLESAQIGPARRYLAGTGSPAAYQPTPNPSTFMVPWHWRRGAHAWVPSPCGGSRSSARSVAGGPR